MNVISAANKRGARCLCCSCIVLLIHQTVDCARCTLTSARNVDSDTCVLERATAGVRYVRGCGARWDGSMSMRAAPTGRACGTAPNPSCGAPADACGPGWGVCLSHSSPSLDTDTFISLVDPATCGVPTGAFLAAMSHAPFGATSCPNPANHSLDNECSPAPGYGSEPLCCGAVCGVPSCSTALWPGKTRALFGAEAAGSCGGVVTPLITTCCTYLPCHHHALLFPALRHECTAATRGKVKMNT